VWDSARALRLSVKPTAVKLRHHPKRWKRNLTRLLKRQSAQNDFLGVLIDNLMTALVAKGVMNRCELQAVENAVSERTFTQPRHR
jgi:hypothetical protein